MIAGLSLTVSSAPAQSADLTPPVLFDFEAPDFHLGSVDGQWGWWVDQGVANVVVGAGLDGSAGLSVEAAALFSQARLTLVRPPVSGDVLFFDAWVRVPAGPWLVFDESLDIDSARIGLFRSSAGSDDAEWHVFHGDGNGGGFWLNTAVPAAVDPFTDFTLNWTRLTVREDLAGNSWDIWADGVLLAAGLGLQYPAETSFTHFLVLGDTRLPVLLDDVTVSAENPLGPDADRDGVLDADEPAPPDPAVAGNPEADLTDTDADGLPDAWEIAHGFNPEDPSDAISDADGDGLTALDEYLMGTDAAAADVRLSVVSLTAAVFNRFAGTSARRAVRSPR